jgi:hypothetical protein
VTLSPNFLSANWTRAEGVAQRRGHGGHFAALAEHRVGGLGVRGREADVAAQTRMACPPGVAGPDEATVDDCPPIRGARLLPQNV